METNINRVLSNRQTKKWRTTKNHIFLDFPWHQRLTRFSLCHPMTNALPPYRVETYIRFGCSNVLLKKYKLGECRHRTSPICLFSSASFAFPFIFRSGFFNLWTDDKAYFRLDYTCFGKSFFFFLFLSSSSFIYSIPPNWYLFRHFLSYFSFVNFLWNLRRASRKSCFFEFPRSRQFFF